MSATTSLFLDLISEKAVELIVTERKQDLHFRLLQAVEEGKNVVITLESYRFKLNFHINAENRHSAPYSHGCGCEYCVARHNYAKLRLDLHRRIKHFDNETRYWNSELSEIDVRTIRIHEREKAEFLEKINLARTKVYQIKEALIKIGMPV